MPVVAHLEAAGIVCATISNPARRNALDQQMFEQLAALWPELAADASVRVVLLRGDGPRAFCSGAALDADVDQHPDVDRLVDAALLKTGYFPKPLVAAINGACVAGGLELALSADIRIAAQDASIGLPEVRWGIVPSGGGAMKLADQIGHAHAMDLLLTGRLITGREAAEIGLVSAAVPAGSVWDVALDRARAIAANSPSAVAATKRASLSRRSATYGGLEPEERRMVAAHRLRSDMGLGKAAFLAKRSPVFEDEPGGSHARPWPTRDPQ